MIHTQTLGPYDIISDIHGCFDELIELLDILGYSRIDKWQHIFDHYVSDRKHPANRTLIIAGDLVDRGPRNLKTLAQCKALVDSGTALITRGNHDDNLLGWLRGYGMAFNGNGLEGTLAELRQAAVPSPSILHQVQSFLESLPFYLLLDEGKLLVVHGGLPEQYQQLDPDSETFQQCCLWGPTAFNGRRVEWAPFYGQSHTAFFKGKFTDVSGPSPSVLGPLTSAYADQQPPTPDLPFIVYGHTPHAEVEQYPLSINIDTGGAFGGKFTAFRWPEQTTLSVPAIKQKVGGFR